MLRHIFMEHMIKYLDLKEVTASHSDEINGAVKHVVDSGWYLKGNFCNTFESEYSSFIGTRYCIGCGNGLDALPLFSVHTLKWE